MGWNDHSPIASRNVWVEPDARADESEPDKKLANRRKTAHYVLGEAKQISPTILQFTCPEGHDRAWAHLDGRGVYLRCPGGRERSCAEELRAMAGEINEQLREEGDDLLPIKVEDTATEAEKERLTAITIATYRRVRPQVLAVPKTMADLEAASPIPVADVAPERHWKLLIERLFRRTERGAIWFGPPWETGPQFHKNFREPFKWLAIPDYLRDGCTLRQAPGPQLCLGTFRAADSDSYLDNYGRVKFHHRPGACNRRKASVIGQYLFNAEGDKMSLDEQATIALWLTTKMEVYAVIYSGHKSLHILLYPPNRDIESGMAMLRGFNFDLNNFRLGGTARCPGWFREPEPEKGMTEGAWQRLVYLRSPFWIH